MKIFTKSDRFNYKIIQVLGAAAMDVFFICVKVEYSYSVLIRRCF